MNFIKRERLRRGWSLREMAELAGVSRQTIWNIEKGNCFSTKTLMKLAGILNCKPEELIDGQGDK